MIAQYERTRAGQVCASTVDLRMTLRYAHLSPAHLRGAVERLEGLGEAAAPPAPVPESTLVGTQAGT